MNSYLSDMIYYAKLRNSELFKSYNYDCK